MFHHDAYTQTSHNLIPTARFWLKFSPLCKTISEFELLKKQRKEMATKAKGAEKVPEHLKPVTMTGLKEKTGFT